MNLSCNAPKTKDEEIEYWKNCCLQEEESRLEAVAELKLLRELIRCVRDNYDCDEDGHKYSGFCRACEAEKLCPKNVLHF